MSILLYYILYMKCGYGKKYIFSFMLVLLLISIANIESKAKIKLNKANSTGRLSNRLKMKKLKVNKHTSEENKDTHCSPLDDLIGEFQKKKDDTTSSGHYEKVVKKVEKYFWVNGKNPSGLPGAYVVPEDEALGKYRQNRSII
jgi:hypothetical protein